MSGVWGFVRDPGDTEPRKRDYTRSAIDPRDTDLDGWGLYPPPDSERPLGLTRLAGFSQSAQPSRKTKSSRRPRFSRKAPSSRAAQPKESARLVQSPRAKQARGSKWFRSLVAGYRRIPRLVRWPVI